MPAAYVKPYVKRQKNDAADAETICEAVTIANVRFVKTKPTEQQSCLNASSDALAVIIRIAKPVDIHQLNVGNIVYLYI
jgi:transposase